MPPITSPAETMPIVEPYRRPAITRRGEAALRLSEFSDVWDELSPADRAWFAPWLNELLIDAVLSEASR